MKKRVLIIVFSIFIFSFLYSQKDEKKVKELVSVVNVEIPVRVFYKKELVDNLKKEDFSLIVNGRGRNIVGFNIKRKTIEIQNIKLKDGEPEYPPRYFILAMNLTNFSPEIKKGVEHVLTKILKKNDALLVFINSKSQLFRKLDDIEIIKEKIFQLIDRESIIARKRMSLYFTQLEKEIDITRFRLSLKQMTGGRNPVNVNDDTRYISSFLRKYTLLWKDYKNKYLIPDVRTYLLFSEHLRKVNTEKWVLNFYQQELFPKIIISGEIMRMIQVLINKWQASGNSLVITSARLISKQISEIRQEMNVAKGFPTDEITKIFTKVGATFHSIFIDTTIGSFSKDIEYKKISTDLENNLRSLTKRTGGELVRSKDLEMALNSIVKKQDIYYVLTYSPREGEKLKKLKIKVHKRKHVPEYDDNLRSEFTKKPSMGIIVDKNAEIKINTIDFKDKKLSFILEGFGVQKNKKGTFGQIDLNIKINNLQDVTIFNKSRKFVTSTLVSNIALEFKWLKKGRYEIVIEAKDTLTGKMASDFIQIKVD
ncbi:MAG: hypothetical protein ABFR75_13455 [Acidobacteriota bacterium]